MGHLRHPIQYRVALTANDSERRVVRDKLTNKIEEKLRLQITATRPAAPARYSSERMRVVRDDLNRLDGPLTRRDS